MNKGNNIFLKVEVSTIIHCNKVLEILYQNNLSKTFFGLKICKEKNANM